MKIEIRIIEKSKNNFQVEKKTHLGWEPLAINGKTHRECTNVEIFKKDFYPATFKTLEDVKCFATKTKDWLENYPKYYNTDGLVIDENGYVDDSQFEKKFSKGDLVVYLGGLKSEKLKKSRTYIVVSTGYGRRSLGTESMRIKDLHDKYEYFLVEEKYFKKAIE